MRKLIAAACIAAAFSVVTVSGAGANVPEPAPDNANQTTTVSTPDGYTPVSTPGTLSRPKVLKTYTDSTGAITGYLVAGVTVQTYVPVGAVPLTGTAYSYGIGCRAITPYVERQSVFHQRIAQLHALIYWCWNIFAFGGVIDPSSVQRGAWTCCYAPGVSMSDPRRTVSYWFPYYGRDLFTQWNADGKQCAIINICVSFNMKLWVKIYYNGTYHYGGG